MNYKIEERSKFVSTSLQGYLKASYEELVKVFGEPQCTTPSGDGKVDVEWDMNILDEDHNAIRNPDYIWHIGGTSGIVDMYINEYFKKKVA
jgi:hypothetical protein